MRPIATLLVLIALLGLAPLAAQAQQGDVYETFRAIRLAPDDASQRIVGAGSELDVHPSWGVEYGLTYMLTDVLGVETMIGATRVDLSLDGGANHGQDAGTIWMAPVTVILQYRPQLLGDYHPYIGLGVTAGVFCCYDASDEMLAAGLVDVEMRTEVDAAAQLGLDYDTAEHWYLNIDVKYLAIGTEVDLEDAGAEPYDTIELDVEPWVLGLGIGYRF